MDQGVRLRAQVFNHNSWGVVTLYKEKDIVYEKGTFWVLRTRTGYVVLKNNTTHSESDGIEYPLTEDGLSIAKKYCDYRARSFT